MKNSSNNPNPDPTIPNSLDYLLELNDDGKQPEEAEPEIIVIPPVPPFANGAGAPSTQPGQRPQA
jgi:hypothetical protein